MGSIAWAFSSKGWPAAGDATSMPLARREVPSGNLATAAKLANSGP